MSNMIVITIEAPGLVEAIKELAAALGGRKAEPAQAVTQNAAMSTQAIGQSTAPAAVPVAPAPTYSREQIMTAGAALIDAGKMDELMGLLGSFGVQAVTQLGQEQLGAFATELRKLGAQI